MFTQFPGINDREEMLTIDLLMCFVTTRQYVTHFKDVVVMRINDCI